MSDNSDCSDDSDLEHNFPDFGVDSDDNEGSDDNEEYHEEKIGEEEESVDLDDSDDSDVDSTMEDNSKGSEGMDIDHPPVYKVLQRASKKLHEIFVAVLLIINSVYGIRH